MAKKVVPLTEVTFADYEAFRAQQDKVTVEGKPIPLTGPKTVNKIHPDEFKREESTVWSFPNRGDWATHKANYRGNWSPYIVRNILEWYSEPGDLVLDQMVGGGTTLVECKVMGRNAIGVDINPDAVMLTLDRLNFSYNSYLETLPETNIGVFHGDARQLDQISTASIGLVATHPPYANIIPYSKAKPVEGDLSQVHSLNEFFDGLSLIASESFRVLKPGGHAAILIGDTHKHAHFVPLSYRTLEIFLSAGFVLREDVIKLQWHTETMRGRWHPRFKRNFLLTYHEQLFIFRKLREDERPTKFRASMDWHVQS
jgi:SAM-dependent methyltransferase